MKTMKKILCAVLISLMTLFVVPVVMPLNDTVYTVEAASVKISKTKYTMNKGEKYTLKIKGTKKKVKWSTSNKKVATVSSKGKVTAKKNGTATITAKVGNKKYKCKITVKDPTISKSKICIAKGDTYTLKVKNTNQKIKWSTSNKKVATVNSKGKVTAKKKGTATITAKVGSKKLKCKVTVETMSISKTNITLEEGNTYTLQVKDTKQDVKWSSNNKNVATVDSKGKVTAKKAGTATITAEVGNKKLKCKVTVKELDYKKYIETSYIKLPNEYIVISIKNNSKITLDYIDLEVKFYKNGLLVGSRLANTACLKKGHTAYDSINLPYDSNYDPIDYDSVKITVTNVTIYQYIDYTDLSKDLTITSNRIDNSASYGVVAEVTNTGNNDIVSGDIGVFYYKDNKIIGYDNEYIWDLDSGSSKALNFRKPTDLDYKELDYDSYKVVINYAYTNK